MVLGPVSQNKLDDFIKHVGFKEIKTKIKLS